MAEYHIIVCSSTNQMLRAQKILREQSIGIELIPVPAEFGTVCNTAIKLASNDLEKVQGIINKAEIHLNGIYPLKPRKYESIMNALKTKRLPKFTNILQKIQNQLDLTVDELTYLLASDDIEQELFKVADRMRAEIVGDEVEIRGAIEFSNFCRKNCDYCGLRRDNNQTVRYRMQTREIVDLAIQMRQAGIKTIILQSGEDQWYTTEKIISLIKSIRSETGLRITLSLGERTQKEYEAFRSAGATNYLLKIETTDEKMFSDLHGGELMGARAQHLKWLKELGYLVGSGNIIGLPGQSVSHIAQDLMFFKEMGIHMVGIGPFIPAQGTPLENLSPGPYNLSLRTIAVARLYLRNVFLPSTTALATLNDAAQAKGLEVGANKLMIIATPERYRADYCIYDNKKAVNMSDAISIVKTLNRRLPNTIAEEI